MNQSLVIDSCKNLEQSSTLSLDVDDMQIEYTRKQDWSTCSNFVYLVTKLLAEAKFIKFLPEEIKGDRYLISRRRKMNDK